MTLEVERTSVWLFTNHRSKFVCRSLYRRSLGRQMRYRAFCASEASLDASVFPAYIRALERGCALARVPASPCEHYAEAAYGLLFRIKAFTVR